MLLLCQPQYHTHEYRCRLSCQVNGSQLLQSRIAENKVSCAQSHAGPFALDRLLDYQAQTSARIEAAAAFFGIGLDSCAT